MQFKQAEEVVWLQFEHFSAYPRLKHAVFLRSGGASVGPYGSLNVGDASGDAPANVAANRKLIGKILDLDELVFARQVHGKAVCTAAKGCKETPECDALTTSDPALGLVIQHADCQAAILYDPLRHAVANVHAGWRGSAANILAATVAAMQACYGSKPQDLLVGISPSLGPEHAEFIHYREELPESFWQYQIKPNHFDFWEISRAQLIKCGVKEHHIEIARLCTYADPERFFSYRRERQTGRHATVVSLL